MREPSFTDVSKFNTHYGDEDVITNLERMGRLGEKIPGGPDLTDSDLQNARKAADNSVGAKI